MAKLCKVQILKSIRLALKKMNKDEQMHLFIETHLDCSCHLPADNEQSLAQRTPRGGQQWEGILPSGLIRTQQS